MHDKSTPPPFNAGFKYPPLEGLQSLMADLRKQRRPAHTSSSKDKTSSRSTRQKRARATVEEMEDHNDREHALDEEPDDVADAVDARPVIDGVLDKFEMCENEEQELTMRLLDHHERVSSLRGDQLLMYTGGSGGTGKSHIIRAVRDYMIETGQPDCILVSAPTGIAARLISGYTIHALTCLNIRSDDTDGVKYTPLTSKQLEELMVVWKNIRYLIIEEISMLSALQLAFISKRLKEIKKGTPNGDKPFRGINILVTGDFGQLEPVAVKSLFAASVVSGLDKNLGTSDSGQFATHGAYLWRLFTKVVILKQIIRQVGDPEYAELLSRVRLGKGTTYSPEGTETGSDYDIIMNRTLDAIKAHDPDQLLRFADAPIIVGNTATRDVLNLRVVHMRAARLGVVPTFLCAKDRKLHSKELLSGSVARQAITVQTKTKSNNVMGCIPYYPGMRVMVTENLDMRHRVVNGQEADLVHVAIEKGLDDMDHATCGFIEVEEIRRIAEGLPLDIVPIFPSTSTHKFHSSFANRDVKFTREQLPLLPVYVYTGYKSQGRSLDNVIVDIASTKRTEGMYVMLSRVRSLQGLAVLRPFTSTLFARKLSKQFVDDFTRLDIQAERTRCWFLDAQHPEDNEMAEGEEARLLANA